MLRGLEACLINLIKHNDYFNVIYCRKLRSTHSSNFNTHCICERKRKQAMIHGLETGILSPEEWTEWGTRESSEPSTRREDTGKECLLASTIRLIDPTRTTSDTPRLHNDSSSCVTKNSNRGHSTMIPRRFSQPNKACIASDYRLQPSQIGRAHV